jgi:hypothetical protein
MNHSLHPATGMCHDWTFAVCWYLINAVCMWACMHWGSALTPKHHKTRFCEHVSVYKFVFVYTWMFVCVCADCLNVREFMCKLAWHVRECVSVQFFLNSTCSSRTIMFYNLNCGGAPSFSCCIRPCLAATVAARQLVDCKSSPLQFIWDSRYQSRDECYCKFCPFLNTTTRECVPVTSICALDPFTSKGVQSKLRQWLHPLLPAVQASFWLPEAPAQGSFQAGWMPAFIQSGERWAWCFF